MRGPIIIGHLGKVTMFQTVREAIRDMDPTQMEKGEHQVYGPDGQVLEAAVDQSGKVTITPTSEHAADELRALLRSALQAIEAHPEGGRDWLDAGVTLSELVDALWLSGQQVGSPNRPSPLARRFPQGRRPGQ